MKGSCVLDAKPSNFGLFLMIHDKMLIVSGDESFKFLTHQLSMVGYWLTMAVTGNGESGFDFWRGSHYQILTQGGGDKKTAGRTCLMFVVISHRTKPVDGWSWGQTVGT